MANDMDEFRYRLRQMAEERGIRAPGSAWDENDQAMKKMAGQQTEMEGFAKATGKGEAPEWWKKVAGQTWEDDMAEFMEKAPPVKHSLGAVEGAAEARNWGYLNRWTQRAKTIGSAAANFGEQAAKIPGARMAGRLAGRVMGPLGVAADVYGIGMAGLEGYRAHRAGQEAEVERLGSEAKYGDVAKATATRHLRQRAAMGGGMPDRVVNELDQYGPWSPNRISSNEAVLSRYTDEYDLMNTARKF